MQLLVGFANVHCSHFQAVTSKIYCLSYLLLLPKIAWNSRKLNRKKDCSTGFENFFYLLNLK